LELRFVAQQAVFSQQHFVVASLCLQSAQHFRQSHLARQSTFASQLALAASQHFETAQQQLLPSSLHVLAVVQQTDGVQAVLPALQPDIFTQHGLATSQQAASSAQHAVTFATQHAFALQQAEPSAQHV